MDTLNIEDWLMLCISDYAGQCRGKGVPLGERGHRYAQGMGLAPTSLMISAFGQISASPWGPRGELLQIPDPETEVFLPAMGEDGSAERFVLCDIVDLKGSPWECCPRLWLARGLETLKKEFGLELRSAFEHEFHYTGASGRLGDSYLLDGMRLQGKFLGLLMAAMRSNGIEPECIMPEYGESQFEVTMKPASGVRSADNAVRFREIARAIARGLGQRVSFAPVLAPNVVGNGVHVHFSLEENPHKPISYDPRKPHSISAQAAAFVAGILANMRELLALTAPSVVSYERLQPNRWSATWNNLGLLDREAGVRLSPISLRPDSNPAKNTNFEYRASDAAANPYLVLGALVYAGIEGLRKKMKLPIPTNKDPESMKKPELKRHGLQRLPKSLEEALSTLESSKLMKAAMGKEFLNAYLVHKRGEISQLEGLELDEICRRYSEAY